MSPQLTRMTTSLVLAASLSSLPAVAAERKERAAKAEGERPKPPPAKVAVVDIVHVFNEYRRAKDLTKEMEAFRDKMKAEGEKRAAECKALQERIKALADGADEAEKLKAELQEKGIALETWMKAKQAEALGKHKRLTEEMYKEIVSATGRIARRRGFLVVLNAQHKLAETSNTQALLKQIRSRTVLYADQRVHLCKDVLKELNEAYRRKQKTQKKADPPSKAADDL